MDPHYKGWSLYRPIFTIRQSAYALGMGNRDFRTFLQIFESLLEEPPQEFTPFIEPRLLSFWDNLTLLLAIDSGQVPPLDRNVLQALYDDLSFLIPEESEKLVVYGESDLIRFTAEFLRSFKWDSMLPPTVEAEYLSGKIIKTFNNLDSFVQKEAL